MQPKKVKNFGLIIKVFILFQLYQTTLCNEVDIEMSIPGNANKLIDVFVEKIKEDLRNQLEPANLTDFEFYFKRKIFFINYVAEASLKNGRLYGLSSLHRNGACSIKITEEKLSLISNLAVNDLYWEYLGRISFLGLSSRYELFGKIGIISAEFVLEVKQEDEAEITEFNIQELSGVEIQVKNRRILNSILKLFTKTGMKFFKSKIKNSVEKHLKKVMNKEIKSVKISDILAQSYQ